MVLQLTCNDDVTHLHTDLFGNAAGFYSFILEANARGRVPKITLAKKIHYMLHRATTKNKQDSI